MTAHLTPDEQIDALDGALQAGRARHLESCSACRDEVARLRETFEAARGVEVPEPSPLFWQHQAARISDLAAAESIERPRSTWTYAAWVGGAAAVMAAGLLFVRPSSTPAPLPAGAVQPREVVAAPSQSALREMPDERAWSVVEDLGGEIDTDAATAALTPAAGSADRAVEDLDADEQAELVRVLQRELKGKTG